MLQQSLIKYPQLRFPTFKDEWHSVSINDIASKKNRWSFTGGPFGSNLKAVDYTENGVRILQLQNIGDGFFNDSYKIYTSDKKADELISCNIYPGEILISKMGDPVARACIVPQVERRFLMASDGIRLLPENTRYDAYFVFLAINRPQFRKKAIQLSTGTTRQRIGLSKLRAIQIMAPSLMEQKKIASFLTSVDDWIENLTQQKLALENYKKGMMQKLFSQQIRFKDDNGKDFPEWEEKRLLDIAVFLKGSGLPKESISEKGVNRCIRYGELYTSYREIIDNVKSRTDSDKNGAILSEENDVLIPSSGETAIDIATASCVEEEGIMLGGDLNVVRFNNRKHGKFFAFYFSNFLKRQMARLAQGYSVVHLHANHFKTLKILLPVEEEQQRIVSFISFIDKLIRNKERQIEHINFWKKGLMQKLFI